MHEITKLIKVATVGKSLKELCETLDYKDHTYLSSLINGKGNFPLTFLIKVSDKLEIDLDTLINLKNNENAK